MFDENIKIGEKMSEDIKNAPAGELGADIKASCDSITSTADSQPSCGITDEPANDVNASQALQGPGLEVCEGANCTGYSYHDGALLDDESNVVSTSYIKVVASIRTPESREWQAKLEFDNRDGIRKELNVSYSTFHDHRGIVKLLADEGFHIPTGSSKNLLNYLNEAKPTRRIRQINKCGWINDREYICPSFQVLSPDNKEEYALLEGSKDWGYDQKGTLEEWHENVAKYCVDNHILTFSLCVGLSGLLLRFFPQIGTTVINLMGKTSLGKTTALQVASSLCGSSKYVKQWRATDNSLESIAEAYNDGLLILDDLGQVDAKKVGEIAYMLGNQKGKGRCNADSSLKKIKSWSLMGLSSGEVSFEDKLNEDGRKAKGGQKVRFIDIDAIVSDETGVFNVLHGFQSGAELSNYLKEQVSKYYGVPAEEFVKGVKRLMDSDPVYVENPQAFRDKLHKLYEKAKERLFTKFALSDAEGPVTRVAETFALIELAGTLAVSFGVFLATFKIGEAVDFVFGRWLDDRGGKKNVEGEEVVRHLRSLHMRHDARLMEVRNGKTEKNITMIKDFLGYFEIDNGITTYYIGSDEFKKQLCKGENVKTVRNFLKKKGMLITQLDSQGRERDTRKTINGARAYFVTISVKNDDLEDVSSNEAGNQEIESA